MSTAEARGDLVEEACRERLIIEHISKPKLSRRARAGLSLS
jgi:hypothetical protein